MSIWTMLSNWGTAANFDPQKNRYITLSNRASLLVSGFTFLLFLLGLSFFGPIYSVILAFAFSVIFLFPLLLNKVGFSIGSRIAFSLLLSVATLFVSVVDKFDYFEIEELQYFEFRLMLLSATLFPFILFSLNEKKYWITALTVNLICVGLYDPIHNYFGVGYYQKSFTGPNYYFLNYMTLGAFLIIAGSAYFLKSSFEKAEMENESLIRELSHQKNEILKVNQIIEQKRGELAQENIQLSKDLINKNNQLIKTNQELVQHNNDLQQFSYTISHNLRGPVASLNGLLSLFKEEEIGGSNKELLPHFKSSIASLDHTIKDLGNIIDLKNGLSRVREKIKVKEEIGHILTLLNKEIIENEIQIVNKVEDSIEFLSVKPMITSIFHNLISNAIKYKSTEREPFIIISTTITGDYAALEVADNGLGIDLNLHKENIFGIYKRFHTHVEGKGLGLFLVKLQAESLGGHVEVSSSPGSGTTFRIFIRVQETEE